MNGQAMDRIMNLLMTLPPECHEANPMSVKWLHKRLRNIKEAEIISALDERGIVDFKLIWNQFSIDMLHYYNAITTKPIIGNNEYLTILDGFRNQAMDLYGDGDLYTEYEKLCSKFVQYNNINNIDAEKSIDHFMNFMKHESNRN